jgi:ABC-2 type transport system permease protein
MAESKLLTIVAREYVERVRSRWFVAATLLTPAFLVLLLFLPAILGERERRGDQGTIRIVDATPDAVGQLVATSLRGGVTGDASRAEWEAATEATRASVEARAVADVAAGRLVGVLVLDTAAISLGRPRYAGRNTTALLTMQQLEAAVTRAVLARRLEARGLDARESAALAGLRLRLDTERLTARGRGGSGQLSVLFAIGVAVTLYLTIFLHGSNVMRGVLEEKQSRVAEVVLSSVPSTTLLLGKVLGIGAVGLTQLALWTASSAGLLAIRAPLLARFGLQVDAFSLPDLGWGLAAIVLLSFLLGFLLYAALFATVGAMVSSEQDAQQAQLPVVLLLVLSLAMVQGIVTTPDGTLARVMTLLPVSAPIVLPLRLSLTPIPGGEAAAAIALLALTAALATLLSARVYRTGVLMYGKRATLRELWRWLRAR